MKNFSIVIGVVALTIGLSIGIAALVMALWNWVMVGVFGLPAISLWLAWGLMILCGILFKSSVRVTTKKRA